MNESKPRGSTILNATKWSLLTQIITKVIPPLTSMILARIFAPEVFGIIATITMITSFADTFSESGFQKYIISKNYDNDSELELDADVSFWTNFAISILLWLIICIFSKPLCALLGNPGVETGLIVACAQLPITSLSSIQSAFYQRNYNYRRFFWSQLVSTLTTLVVTLGFALGGLGYWAIILGNIVGYLLRAVILSIRSYWHPHFYYDFKRAKKIMSLSLWIMAEGLAVWLTSWFDSFVVGNRLNSHDLGIYKNSQSVVNGLLSVPQNAITNVMLVTLSRVRDDVDQYNNAFLTSQRLLAFALLPLAAGLFVYKKLAVRIAFGAGWEDAELVVGVWALASVLRVLFVSINTAVYISKGKPKISLYCQIIDMLILVPVCLLCISLGFQRFVVIRGIVRLDLVIPNFIILSKCFGIRFSAIIRNVSKPVLATALMTVLAVGLTFVSLSVIWQIASIVICITFYVTLLFFIAKEDVITLLKMIKVRREN